MKIESLYLTIRLSWHWPFTSCICAAIIRKDGPASHNKTSLALNNMVNKKSMSNTTPSTPWENKILSNRRRYGASPFSLSFTKITDVHVQNLPRLEAKEVPTCLSAQLWGVRWQQRRRIPTGGERLREFVTNMDKRKAKCFFKQAAALVIGKAEMK